jgi:cytochrome c biogenesis protein CcdA/thiol-disulfide isomerase/thioredoxin
MSIINSHTTLALAEGFGLAFSPCILPILPFILAASSVGNRSRPFLIIGGFVASFTAFALLSRKILAVSGIQQDTIQYIAYGLLLLLSLTMIVPYLERGFASLTNRIATGAENFSSGKRAEGIFGGLLVGALIGVVWTPCAGPILAAALLQVIQAQTSFEAITTMLAFSIGAAIPMLAISLFGQQMAHRIRAFSKHTTLIRRGMGVVIAAFALLGLFGFNIGEWVVSPSTNVAPPAVADATPELMAETAVAQIQTPAPEIAGITQWLNSDPLTIAQLKGKVVLVDFWTYTCINCIRTLPYIESWYEKYKDQGLVVIGVHSPEFPFEGKPDNVKVAIKKFGISYPVAMDNDYGTWNAYHNKYWPAHYLIDRNGMIVDTHFGEGGYSETENKIRALLGITQKVEATQDTRMTSADQTPETYLGYTRSQNFADKGAAVNDQSQRYHFPESLQKNQWALSGTWTISGDRITADQANASLRLNFKAGKVYLVLGSKTGKPVKAKILLNGATVGTVAGKDGVGKDGADGAITVDQHRLYELINQPAPKDGLLDITATMPGLEAYAFTFGN